MSSDSPKRAVFDCFAEVAKAVPNVFVERQVAGTGAGASAYIRGIGANDFAFNLDPGEAAPWTE